MSVIFRALQTGGNELDLLFLTIQPKASIGADEQRATLECVRLGTGFEIIKVPDDDSHKLDTVYSTYIYDTTCVLCLHTCSIYLLQITDLQTLRNKTCIFQKHVCSILNGFK